MSIDSSSYYPTRRTVPRRTIGVVVCLLALLMAMLGHLEPASAAPAFDDYSVTANDHADLHADRDGSVARHHCLNSGHCAFQAVLPLAPTVSAQMPAILRRPVGRIGVGRAVAPCRHPPRTTDIG